MLTKTIDIKKKSPDIKVLLSLVADGTEIVLTENDTPIARLVQIEKRVAGLHAGTIRMSEDFDEPLPDEFWIEDLSRSLEAPGLKPLDALHLAFASAAKVDYFCTCDDKFLKKARCIEGLYTKVISPTELVMELDI